MCRVKQLFATAISLFLISHATASTCSYSRIEIKSLNPEKNDIFAGSLDFIEIRFHSDKNDSEVAVFPEPPLTIVNTAQKSHCAIDGGAWVRKAVFISNDKSTVAAQEFSGSNDFLNFYSTRTCRKIAMVDISNSTWELDRATLRVLRKDPPRPTNYTLSPKCKPVKVNQRPKQRTSNA